VAIILLWQAHQDRPEGPTPLYRFSPLWRFIVLYAALYGAFGVLSPFLPQFLEQRGLSAQEIGTLLAAGTAVRLVSGPLAGRLADRWRAWRSLLAGCAAAAGIAATLYLPFDSFWPLLIVSLIQATALAPLAPLADAITVTLAATMAGKAGGFEYGWVRGAGSAAFIVGSLAAGLAAASFGWSVLIWLNAFLLVLAAIGALPLPDPAQSSSQPPNEPHSHSLGDLSSLRLLLAIPAFRRLLLVGALVLGSHALHDTFAMIRWSAAGISPFTASVLWSESVAAEVAMFLLIGPALLHRLGPARAATLAAAAGALRWTIMAVTTNTAAMALVEPLHGFSFALLHLAAMQLIGATVPLRLAATAQAVYGTLAIGAATAVLTLASGWLYAAFAGASFLVMALLCLAAIPLTAGLSTDVAPDSRARRS
jgi:PPP family 3-phenylpropionic acid transporter